MNITNNGGPWASAGAPAVDAGPALRSVAPASPAAQLAAMVRGRTAANSLPACADDRLRVRHLVAARRAEAVRLAEHARWSQHNADVCWYAGKLRVARQFDDQAARLRQLGAWLTAEADALGRSL
jgi:hypothetical protein